MHSASNHLPRPLPCLALPRPRQFCLGLMKTALPAEIRWFSIYISVISLVSVLHMQTITPTLNPGVGVKSPNPGLERGPAGGVIPLCNHGIVLIPCIHLAYTDAKYAITNFQRCSTRVQDLDSSPVFWDLDLRPVDLDLDLDLTPPDLRLVPFFGTWT